MGTDVPEDELTLWNSPTPAEPLKIESIIEVDQLLSRQPEFALEAVHKMAGRRDEPINEV